MRLHVIQTGSGGNCYALHGDHGFLLLDAGVPYREIVRAVGSFDGLRGCLITHEHNDHSAAVTDLAMLGVTLCMSLGTLSALKERPHRINPFAVRRLQPMQKITLGEFTVVPFDVQHDAAEPFGYLIRHDPTGEQLLYMTDTHFSRFTFPGVHYWLVECNYVDEIMSAQVDGGKLAKQLQTRLHSSHFSLRRLKEALLANDLSKTRTIVLIHLSNERSDEARMVSEITESTGVHTIAASGGMVIELNTCPF